MEAIFIEVKRKLEGEKYADSERGGLFVIICCIIIIIVGLFIHLNQLFNIQKKCFVSFGFLNTICRFNCVLRI